MTYPHSNNLYANMPTERLHLTALGRGIREVYERPHSQGVGQASGHLAGSRPDLEPTARDTGGRAYCARTTGDAASRRIRHTASRKNRYAKGPEVFSQPPGRYTRLTFP